MSDQECSRRIYLGQENAQHSSAEASVVLPGAKPFDDDGYTNPAIRGILSEARKKCPRASRISEGRYPISECALTHALGILDGEATASQAESEVTIVVSTCGINAGSQCVNLCQNVVDEISEAIKP